ncbi:MAG: hypothetical protein AAF957_27235 [Planctomycetota bacterium]
MPSARTAPIAFDLDVDGQADSLYLPNAGSGFLAFDQNANGAIDDGSELAGAQSGDPFGDLSLLDANSDGWLDGADPAFSGVVVWLSQGSSGAGSVIPLSSTGVSSLLLSSETLDSGQQAIAFEAVDGSVGFITTVDADVVFEVEPITACSSGHPKGTCADYQPDEDVPYIWKCSSDGAACTNNQNTAGVCESTNDRYKSWCTCTGSELSPILDFRWVVALGALMAALTGLFASARSASGIAA